MYLLLLVFGGALTAAGVLLGASGVSVHERTFDTTIVTPGVVAAVGGFLLIGLGLALRALQRIEQAIALRRIPPREELREPAQIPLPKPALHPVGAPAAASEKHAESFSEQTAALARLDPTRVAEEAELSLPPVAAPPPTSVDVAVAEAEKTHTAKRKNGAGPGRVAPRLDMNLRSPVASERPNGPSFDALWPKGPRSLRAAPLAPAQAAAVPAEEPEARGEPAVATIQTLAPEAVSEAATEPVSVLKSGVVDGMAYTLYSDGSIEAQLPQGMLRFGSITELRNHIEQSA
jgi:hypothetical protein